jgi:hypothetical protein
MDEIYSKIIFTRENYQIRIIFMSKFIHEKCVKGETPKNYFTM